MIYDAFAGVPKFRCDEIKPKQNKYCLIIPIINEGERIRAELIKAQSHRIDQICDIIVCDGGSTDGSTDINSLKQYGVNTLLTKLDVGAQSTQLRMGFWWVIERGYEGIITIDGNNKDSIEDVPQFISKLDEGYDFVQGSRFVKGGSAVNTPAIRYLGIKLLHAPLISYVAKHKFTDTTNAFRAYSKKYIMHPKVQPFRDVFVTYELLAYLSVRASQLEMKVCEIPVTRSYPKGETPSKISPIKGSIKLLIILLNILRGKYTHES